MLTIIWKTRGTDSGTEFHRRVEFQNSDVVVEGEDAEVGVGCGTDQFPLNCYRLRLAYPVMFPYHRADVFHIVSETSCLSD